MSLTFCLILIAAGLIWSRLRTSYLATGLTITGFGLMLLIGLGILPAMQLSATQLTNSLSAVTWADRNSIVLLGAGTAARSKTLGPDVPAYAYGRIVTGVEAWRDCEAHGKDCNIVVSGGDPEHHGAAEATIYGKALLALGVPQSAIMLETQSRNTWQNAAFSMRLIAADRQVVVVTSGLHLKRSLVFFNHVRPGAQGIAGDRLTPAFGPLWMGYNVFVCDAALHEEIGLLQYHVYSAMGWNKKAA
jgi:uncharacterized SAM-binding protein YcdF (DUF218 family)